MYNKKHFAQPWTVSLPEADYPAALKARIYPRLTLFIPQSVKQTHDTSDNFTNLQKLTYYLHPFLLPRGELEPLSRPEFV